MGFGIVNKLAAQSDMAPSVEQWNEARAREFGLLKEQQEDSISAEVAQMHWLSLACFAEGIEPASIALNNHLLERVSAELKKLADYSSLEAYAACLEQLGKTLQPEQEVEE
jgi:hypothetical protein